MATIHPPLSDADRGHFLEHGWLILRGVFTPDQIQQCRDWTSTFTQWAEEDGPGLHHFEHTESGPRIARSEDLVPNHPGADTFIRRGAIIEWVGALLGEPAVLYKEKVNYKHPGGGGFAPHQDATAYRFVDHHISVMVPLDPATTSSGCLYVAEGHGQGKMPTDDRGCIDADHAAQLPWKAAEVHPGDVLLFDSYTPHHSDTNRTQQPRRAFYLTYNALSLGDFRGRYYSDKRAEFQRKGTTFEGQRVRISVTDDFLGRPVPRPPTQRPIEDLFARYDSPLAHGMYDEAVTELEHGLQCAECAERDGADASLVAAALLHDVGHLLIGDLVPIQQELEKDCRHEHVAQRYLQRWFDERVTAPVAAHVDAKRYLVAVDPQYASTLSPSSVRSLAVQGGPMSESECREFESRPGWKEAIQLRRWDDEAKVAGAKTRSFSDFEPLLRTLARQSA